MGVGKIITIISFGVCIILLLIFGIWVYRLKAPHIGTDCHKVSDWVWSDNCLYIQEKFPDSSLESPKNLKPYLISFNFTEGAGRPLYLPMWYRFRYVNVKTGGYSDLSDWTSAPVMSGGCNLPYIDNNSSNKNGYETCNYNQPIIGIKLDSSQYNPSSVLPDGSFVYINLHRYTGTPTDKSPPVDTTTYDIVGFLHSGLNVDGTQYLTWTDVLQKPCANIDCKVPVVCINKTEC